MKTALQNFITRFALEDTIQIQLLQAALDEERDMIVKAYQTGADDAIKSIVDDRIPNGERFYNKTFY